MRGAVPLVFAAAVLVGLVAVGSASLSGLPTPAGELAGSPTFLYTGAGYSPASCSDSDSAATDPKLAQGSLRYSARQRNGVYRYAPPPTYSDYCETDAAGTTTNKLIELSCGGAGNKAPRWTRVTCANGCSNGACLPPPPIPEPPPVPTVDAQCADPDGGADTAVASIAVATSIADGTVVAAGPDTCLSNSRVREYVCTDGNDVEPVVVACKGVCQTQDATDPYGNAIKIGSCVSLSACVDSDNGQVAEKPGVTTTTSATGQKTTQKDSCTADRSAVTEYFCDGTALGSERIPCAANQICVSGACVPKDSQCSDTDGGRNYKSKGTVTNNRGASISDACSGQKGLLEFSCSRVAQTNDAGQVTKWASTSASYKHSRIRVERVTCPGGCADGACAGTQLASPPTAEEAPGEE